MPDSGVHDYIAGALGGAAGTIVGHPFETVKVQIQTQGYGGKLSSLQECFNTVKNQSLSKGFFRGLSVPLLFYGTLDSLFFGIYGLVLRKIDPQYCDSSDRPPHYFAIGVASAVATVPWIALTCPLEVVTITLQAQIPKKGSMSRDHKFFKGPIDAFSSIVKTSGVKGMYRGLAIQSACQMPGAVLYMGGYAMFQHHGSHMFPQLSSQIINFFAGGITGVVTCAIFLPLDVIKSKLQADASKLLYTGFVDCVKNVYKTEGFRAFFLGFWPATLQAFPMNAVTLMVYSECLRCLNSWENKKK